MATGSRVLTVVVVGGVVVVAVVVVMVVVVDSGIAVVVGASMDSASRSLRGAVTTRVDVTFLVMSRAEAVWRLV